MSLIWTRPQTPSMIYVRDQGFEVSTMTVLNSSGTSFGVALSVRNSSGTEFSVPNAVNNSGGSSFTVV